MSEAFTEFLGGAVGGAAGFAAGIAVGPVLEPLLQALRNDSWHAYPDAPIDALLLAKAVAEGKIKADSDTYDEASYTGISQHRFDSLVLFLQNGPGVAAGMELVRRGLIDQSGFGDVLSRAGLESEWITAYTKKAPNGLYAWQQPLDPAIIANAIVRGIMEAPFTLPAGPPTEVGNVPAFPTSGLDTANEALASGTDLERLFVMTAIDGRPMSPVDAAQSYFRGILQLADYQRAISEGDIRNEWADAILAHSRQILTAHDYVELHLRGWIDATTMYAGTALHGMSQADSDLLLEVTGRPLAIHQITTGLARGGVYNPQPGELTDPYQASVRQSNIRPEYYDLAIANKHTLPSYFVFKAILAAGMLTVDEVAEYFTQEGWPPDLAQKAAASLAPSTTTGTKALSVTQIKQAFEHTQMTQAEALTQLQAHGYSLLDAQRLLGVAPTVASG